MALDGSHWQARLHELASEHGVVGASLAVRHGDDTAEAAHGVLNLRTQQPATPDSVFQVGSITKVWTAVLVMQLVDEGLVGLDEPVVRHLPDFRVADEELSREVTVRELLCHTSGIDGDFFLDTGRGDDALERYVAAMSHLQAVHPRGATMSYCNSGFSVLGRLVEVLRDSTWDAALRERLLAPLGLASAGTLPEEALLWGAATGHVPQPGQEQPGVAAQWGLYRSAGPAGLLHSTARDQVAFARALVTGTAPGGPRLLSQESAEAMQQPQVEVPDRFTLGSHWGLGWIVTDWDGHRVLGHDGATLGQAAFLRTLPDADLTVSLLTNGGSLARELAEDLLVEVVDRVVGVRVPRRPEPTGQRVEEPGRFAGTYRREGMELTVEAHADGLVLRTRMTSPLAAALPDPPPMRLLPFQGDTLLAKGDGGSAWTPAVFFDLAGERYLHHGARANRRVG